MNCPHPLRITTLCLLLAAMVGASARADSLDLANGDHYRGTVISVTQSNVEFQSEMLGRITLVRSKVARITFGDAAIPKPATNSPVASVGPSLIMQGRQNLTPATAPGQSDAVLQQMRQEGVDPALVSAVQEQVFGQGSPVAAQKFNELMGGLMSGTMSIGDLRAQAQDSIQQIKDAKQQLGPDGDLFDGYLAILENFVAESSTNDTITAAPTPKASAPAAAVNPAATP